MAQETFKIDAYSGPVGPALWTEEWHCPLCDFRMTPADVDFSTHCPLHNPMRCAGRELEQPHAVIPCNPIPGAEVFILHLGTGEHPSPRTIIGKIPER